MSLLTAPIVRMGETHDVGNRIGMTLTVLAMGALGGPPISGAINDATGNFKAVGIYAGAFTLLVECLCMSDERCRLDRHGWSSSYASRQVLCHTFLVGQVLASYRPAGFRLGTGAAFYPFQTGTF